MGGGLEGGKYVLAVNKMKHITFCSRQQIQTNKMEQCLFLFICSNILPKCTDSNFHKTEKSTFIATWFTAKLKFFSLLL